MNFLPLLAILAVIIGSSKSFRLDSLNENNKEDRLVGGLTARPSQFPHMASLRAFFDVNNTLDWYHWCGGSIISNRWIISAAHCIEEGVPNPSTMRIVVGAHHIQNDGRTYHLEQIVNHPEYNASNRFNDVMLLQTNETIQFNDFVKPIPLGSKFIDGGVASTISGWGYTQWNSGGMAYPMNLQYLEVNTLTNDECRRRSPSEIQSNIYNGSLCAFGEEGQGVCLGDSGSPLISNGQLIGVVCWGSICARGPPDGFVRVSLFLDWIREVSGIVAMA